MIDPPSKTLPFDGAEDSGERTWPGVDAMRDDQHKRWQAGERLLVEAYMERQPALRADREAILDLIYNEVVLRELRGEAPQLKEYQERFPQLAEPLKDQFDVHRALASSPATDPAATAPMDHAATGPQPLAGGLTEARVPGYEILETLGSGTFGVVYKARHIGLKRLVALKMLRQGAHASAEDVTRFRTEAEAVARLQHPHIVQIFEIGEHAGLPYLALELVNGGSLAQKLDGTPLPSHQAAALVETLAHAMSAAHHQGIVHRDLKPANVLLDFPREIGNRKSKIGNPKITDFGLAKRLDLDSGATKSGAIMGTPSYMAPEQAGGQPTGTAVDIYALGAILYELMTGRPPFRAETALETIFQVLSQEPVPPRRFQPRVPRDLETICLKCLHKEPRQRYPSATALADDLRRFQDHRPIQARPASPIERARKWARRRPALAALIAVSALATFALLALGLRYNSWLQDALRSTEQRELTARRNLYIAHMNLAQRAWNESHVARVQQLLEEWRPRTSAADDLRGFEWYLLDRFCHSARYTLPGHSSVALHSDGVRLAVPGADNTVVIWSRISRQPLRTLRGHTAEVAGVAFSRDGKWLGSASRDRTVKIWDAGANRPPHTLEGHTDVVCAVAFSFDGRFLASASWDKTVRIWEVATRRLLHQLKDHKGSVLHVAFSPTEPRLASASADNTAIIWDTNTGTALRTLTHHTNAVTSVAFSADGRRLASASWDRTVRVWRTSDGIEARTLKGHTGAVAGVAFAPDGTRVASVSWDRTAIVWNVEAGTPLFTFRGHLDRVVGLAWTGAGTELATVSLDNTVRVWDATRDQETRVLNGHRAMATAVAFNRKGDRLASTSYDRTARLWDPATGAAVRTFRKHAGPVTGLAFSPDGDRLATSSEDQTAMIWDVATGRDVATLKGHAGSVTAVAYSPTGGQLATAGADKTIRIWNAPTGLETITLAGHADEVTGIAYGPDGRRLASSSADGSVRIWNAHTGKELLRLLGHVGRVSRIRFGPHGDRLASAGADKTLIIWNAGTGHRIHALRGHTASVHALAFTSDGRRLASAGEDQTIKIWDLQTGQETLSLRYRDSLIWDVAFRPDNRQLAAAGGRFKSGEVLMWDTQE